MATSSQEIRRSFDPSNGLEWTAETDVEFIKNLVTRREDLFAEHRAIIDPDIERQSKDKMARLIAIDRQKAPIYNTYATFCTSVNILAFPLSISSISLFLYAKCSFKEGDYKTVKNYLCSLYRETVTGWKDVDGFNDLESYDQASAELAAFMKERVSRKFSNSRVSGSGGHSDISPQNKAVQETGSSESDAEDEGASGGEGDAESLATRAPHSTPSIASQPHEIQRPGIVVEQLPVTNLPQPLDSFYSAEELLVACYKALLPVYGHGVSIVKHKDGTALIKCGRSNTSYRTSNEGTCKWKIGAVVDLSTGGIKVDQASSFLLHNHGPSSKLKRNPSYRPTIFHPLVRQAFGLPPLISEGGKKRRPVLSGDDEATKKVKLIESSESSASLPYSFPPPSQFSDQHHPTLTALDPSSSSVSHQPVPPRQILPSESCSSNAALSTNLYPQLNSFLKALHPSLVSLTSHLIAAGINCSDSLALLCSLDSATLDKSLKAIQTGAQARNQSISIIHLIMLKKLISEAQVQGYNP